VNPAEQAELLLEVFALQASDETNQTYFLFSLRVCGVARSNLTHGIEHKANKAMVRGKRQERSFCEDYML
jgi:hypothetical protein